MGVSSRVVLLSPCVCIILFVWSGSWASWRTTASAFSPHNFNKHHPHTTDGQLHRIRMIQSIPCKSELNQRYHSQWNRLTVNSIQEHHHHPKRRQRNLQPLFSTPIEMDSSRPNNHEQPLSSIPPASILDKTMTGFATMIRDLSPEATKVSSKVPTYSRLLILASTTVVIWLSEPLLSLVDTTVVSTTGSVIQLASMGPATTLMDTLLYMTYFLSLGTTSLIGQGLAESRWRDLQSTISNILACAAAIGTAVALFTWCACPALLRAMAGPSSSAELLQYAIAYARIRAMVAPAAVMGFVAQSFCLVNLNTRATIGAVLIASIVNITGDLAMSRYGVVGAALATAVASLSSASYLLVNVRAKMTEWRELELEEYQNSNNTIDRQPTEFSESRANHLANEQTNNPQETIQRSNSQEPPTRVPFLSWPNKDALFKLATISGPLMYNMWAKMGCYTALTIAAGRFGVECLAAHNILMRLFFFLATMGDSLSLAAQTFLPLSLYPLDRTAYLATLRRLGALSSLLAVILGTASTHVLHIAGPLLARHESILHVMKQQARNLAWTLWLHPAVVLTEGVVVATRDFRNLVVSYTSTMCIHAWLLTRAASFSSVWTAFVGLQVVRLVNFGLWRKRRRRRTEPWESTAVVS